MINFENDIKSLQWELRDKTELVASLEISLKVRIHLRIAVTLSQWP